MHVVAGGDGGANLVEVLLEFRSELFGFSVVLGVFAFISKGHGVRDDVEVAKVILAYAGELN